MKASSLLLRAKCILSLASVQIIIVVFGEDRKPSLYPSHLFVSNGAAVPKHWIVTHGSEGEIYADPPGLDKTGFYEDYFDGIDEAITTFKLN
ncbi:hypothetical protein [Poriferisphaera corsica]|uniref:hypothetical protein n=1 Tax=Poriferisphaera corsica TaxID=2528020 RepID=UPI0011A556E3|nr:hypothetical protein [Poriferisphaera corsica]